MLSVTAYNRVETEREIPKLKLIYNKAKVRHFVESLLPVSSVQYNIGGTISLLLARISVLVKRQSRLQINSASLNLAGTAEMSGTLKQDTIDAMVT